MANVTLLPVIPLTGLVRVPFRYVQSIYVESGALVEKRPIQSPRLPGPLVTVAVSVPLGGSVVALSDTAGGPAAIVMFTLLPRRTVESSRKKRRLYVPSACGIANTNVAPDTPA